MIVEGKEISNRRSSTQPHSLKSVVRFWGPFQFIPCKFIRHRENELRSNDDGDDDDDKKRRSVNVE